MVVWQSMYLETVGHERPFPFGVLPIFVFPLSPSFLFPFLSPFFSSPLLSSLTLSVPLLYYFIFQRPTKILAHIFLSFILQFQSSQLHPKP